MKTAAIIFAMWMATWPALLADIQSIYTTKESADKNYRSNLGAVMLFGLMPPMWIFTPFITGFYEHGFQITRRSADA